MDRLQYNILLEEQGIYDKKEISAEEIDSCDKDLIYKIPEDNKYYKIIQNNLSTEEIRVTLLAKQTNLLKSIERTLCCIAVIIVVSFLIRIICFIR